MPRRTFWLVTGAVIGAGSSLWAERKVRRTVQQATAKMQPETVVAEVGRSARLVAGGAADRVRDAVSTGRDEMQRREEELWAELAGLSVERRGPAVNSEVPPEQQPRTRQRRTAAMIRRPLTRSAPHPDQ